jgi:hypothetical protein
MRLMSKKKILGVLATGALLTTLVGGPASADLVVNAGTLGFDGGAPAISDFAAVTLNGTPQLTSLTVDPFTVVDATGSGAGWHVLLTVPDLVNGGNTIDASNISMTAPNVSATAGSSMTGVQGNTSAGGFGAGEKIVTATATNGQGTYLVSPRILKLTVPSDTAAGTYTSTATIATVSGP